MVGKWRIRGHLDHIIGYLRIAGSCFCCPVCCIISCSIISLLCPLHLIKATLAGSMIAAAKILIESLCFYWFNCTGIQLCSTWPAPGVRLHMHNSSLYKYIQFDPYLSLMPLFSAFCTEGLLSTLPDATVSQPCPFLPTTYPAYCGFFQHGFWWQWNHVVSHVSTRRDVSDVWLQEPFLCVCFYSSMVNVRALDVI